MEQLEALARAIIAGCGANVGPLIGLDVQLVALELATSETPPEGVLAVLPLGIVRDANELARLELALPLEDLALLARRMLGSDDPDAKQELRPEDLDAVGEILGVMSGALDEGLREQLGPGLRTHARAWWRTDEPGGASFEAGPHRIALASLGIPGAQPVQISLRMPGDLVEHCGGARTRAAARRVVLLDFDAPTGDTLVGALAAAGIEAQQRAASDPDLAGEWRGIDAAIVSADANGMELARRLRLGNETWELPVLICAGGPTRELVIRALDCGASHVLALPAPDTEVLRVLALARARPA